MPAHIAPEAERQEIQSFHCGKKWEPDEESKQSSTVGEKIGQTVEFVACGGDKLHFFKEDGKARDLYSRN